MNTMHTDIQHLASIVQNSNDAIIGKTLAGMITSWNAGAERLYGYSAEEAIGQPISMLIPPDHADDFPWLMSQVSSGQKVDHYETVRQRKDGTRLDVSLTVSPIRDEAETIIGASAIARDITGRKQVELALRRSETRFRTLIETAPGAILLVDESGLIVLVNERVEAIFGYTRDALLGQPVEMLLPQQFRAEHVAYRNGYFEQPGVRPMGIGRDLSGQRKDGSQFPVEIGLSHLQTETGVLALAFVTDITERKRAEEEWAQLLIREQTARAETQRIKFEERERISMELHDGIIQSIYAVGMSLEIARTTLANDGRMNEMLVHATQNLDQIIDDLRRYIRDLKIGTDYSREFQNQLQDIVRNFRDTSSAKLVIDVPESLTFFIEKYLHAVVQLLRESLSNIVRHANATEVHVTLKESPTHITLRISDNGLGFDPQRVELGNGLLNMRQRVEQLNGTVEIVSQDQQGTALTFTFPVSWGPRQ